MRAGPFDTLRINKPRPYAMLREILLVSLLSPKAPQARNNDGEVNSPLQEGAIYRAPTRRGAGETPALGRQALRNERNGRKQNRVERDCPLQKAASTGKDPVDSVKALPDSCASREESSWDRGEGISVEETR